MVRTAHLAFLALTSIVTGAQLANPGFEIDGAFSLAGWEWTCEPPTPVTDTPPGGGNWAVRNNMGNPDCSPNYLFQRIPFAQGGEHWTLGGWARIDTVGWDALPRMGFSSVNNGVFGLQSQIGNPAPYWSYIWIADTVHATATDTAVVLLQSGEGFLGAGWFDALELQPQSAQGLASHSVEPQMSYGMMKGVPAATASSRSTVGDTSRSGSQQEKPINGGSLGVQGR